MSIVHKSDSCVQQHAEQIIFDAVRDWLGIDELDSNPTILLTNAPYPRIVPDFYSEKHLVIGEIFAHIGVPKRGQHNKIANDVLKMLLLDKITGKQFRKIIVVCDSKEERNLLGKSSLAECIRQFDIEVKRIDLDEGTRNRILHAQQQQEMMNRLD